MSEPTKYVFGVLTTYERHGWPHPSILQFFADLPFITGNAYRMIPIQSFIPAASGRNIFAKHFRDSDTDWLVMIDNDMEIPPNVLDTVKDAPADAGIVVPVFYIWNQTKLKLILGWGIGEEDQSQMRELANGYYELRKAGTGVIFIRPWVFQKIKYPYFTYLYNEDGVMTSTEDIQFCQRAQDAGIKIYGNSGVHVGHYHSVELGSMWKWGKQAYGLDKPEAASVDSAEDTERPSVVPVTEACPANVI